MSRLPFNPHVGAYQRVYVCATCSHTTPDVLQVYPCTNCGGSRYEKRVARRLYYNWWQRWVLYPLALRRRAPADSWELHKTGWGLL